MIRIIAKFKHNRSTRFNLKDNLYKHDNEMSYRSLNIIPKKEGLRFCKKYPITYFDDHYPVMWNKIIQFLEDHLFNDPVDTKPKLIGDMTLGAGNHTKLILENFENSLVLGVDLDKDMIEYSKKKLENYLKEDRLAILNDNYVTIDSMKIYDHFKTKKLPANKKFDFILVDLGFNTMQIESTVKGMSYKHREAELDMRYDQDNENKSRACDILNHCSELELSEIFKSFGGEKNVEVLVKKIVEFRDKNNFQKVKDFIDVIDLSFNYDTRKKYERYTRLFQALRISVNYEILNIQRFLSLFYKQIEQGGYLAVITFHSLEDIYVKRYFNQFQIMKIGKIVCEETKPPITEIKENSRSKSAKLRIFKFEIDE